MQFSREMGYSYRWLWEIKILPLPRSGARREIMGWQGATGAHLQYGWTCADAVPVSLQRSICHYLLNKLRANASRLQLRRTTRIHFLQAETVQST